MLTKKQAMKSILDAFEPKEYEVREVLGGDTEYIVREIDIKTGDGREVYRCDNKEDADTYCAYLKKQMAEMAFKKGKIFGNLARDMEINEDLQLDMEWAEMSAKQRKDGERDVNAVCVDNTGYEEYFEVGVSYLVKKRKDGYVIVEDMLGEDREMLAERFQFDVRTEDLEDGLSDELPIEENACGHCGGIGMVVDGDGQKIDCPLCKGSGVEYSIGRVDVARNNTDSGSNGGLSHEEVVEEMNRLMLESGNGGAWADWSENLMRWAFGSDIGSV